MDDSWAGGSGRIVGMKGRERAERRGFGRKRGAEKSGQPRPCVVNAQPRARLAIASGDGPANRRVKASKLFLHGHRQTSTNLLRPNQILAQSKLNMQETSIYSEHMDMDMHMQKK